MKTFEAGSQDGRLTDRGPTDIDATLDFRYVDLSGQTKGISAAHFFNGRLYLGFPDSGAKRPYLAVLKSPPGSPGLDVSTAAQAEDLQADDMPGVGGSASLSIIDAIIDFNDRVYVFNNGGCMRSTTPSPSSYGTTPADWAACTPAAAPYGQPTNVRVFDGAALSFPSSEHVYLTTGDGASAVSLYRIADH